ncbi:hypothetical protein MPH_08705 [Macrophomina phaseolina MS6]|uniref:Uncharacterized protein n=1 Tax=Macrophomina phaseolina (strain MS6) TaxID=1126212 RepID=K2QWH3_MACPH|nr:hypothetical protein MPH_08705 [Macrophomina phaseolina MS6]
MATHLWASYFSLHCVWDCCIHALHERYEYYCCLALLHDINSSFVQHVWEYHINAAVAHPLHEPNPTSTRTARYAVSQFDSVGAKPVCFLLGSVCRKTSHDKYAEAKYGVFSSQERTENPHLEATLPRRRFPAQK